MSARPVPLSSQEATAWLALARVMPHLPRILDDDLLARDGLSLTTYVVLMRLSEAPGHSLRMKDLADAAVLSPSRMTRVVQALVEDGYVARARVPGDGRATAATLTASGLARLEQAWPAHLAGVRQHVLDRVDPADLPVLARILERILSPET